MCMHFQCYRRGLIFFDDNGGDMIFLTLESCTKKPERGYGIFWRKTDGVQNFLGKK